MKIIPDHLRTKFFTFLGWSIPVLALLLIGLVYFLGVRTERTGFVREVLDPGLKRITIPVLNAFRGGVPPVHRIRIELDSAATDSLLSIEKKARKDGWLSPQLNAFFVAKVHWDDSVMTAVVSLQEGIRNTNLQDPLGPLKIRLARGDTIIGMQHFSMDMVTSGSVLQDWVMANALKDQKLPGLGYAIVEAPTSKSKDALHKLVGALDSTSIAAWGIDRPVVGWFGDELFLAAQQSSANLKFPVDPLPQSNWLAAPILTAIVSENIQGAAIPKAQEHIVKALSAFRDGSRSASQVFDVQRLAKLFALSDMLGQQSTVVWWNLRFLPDSGSDRLIAVPHRYLGQSPIQRIQALTTGGVINFSATGSSFNAKLFGDEQFYRTYIAYLDTFSAAGYMERLFERLGPELTGQEKVVLGHYTQAGLDRSEYEHDRAVIQRTLYPKDLMLAYMEDRIGAVDRLAVGNVHSLPVEVVAFVSGKDTVDLFHSIILSPRDPDMPLSYTMLHLNVPKDAPSPSTLMVRPVGLNKMFPVTVRKWTSFPSN